MLNVGVVETVTLWEESSFFPQPLFYMKKGPIFIHIEGQDVYPIESVPFVLVKVFKLGDEVSERKDGGLPNQYVVRTTFALYNF